jgi:choline transport protein
MSEEVRDASVAVPKAMIAVYIINFCLIFPAVLTVACHIPDVPTALADPTTYPVIYVMRQAMTPPWLTAMLAVVSISVFSGR